MRSFGSSPRSTTWPVDHVHVALRARRQFRIVRDHDDGRAVAVDLLEQLHHRARHLRVEIAGRLVGEQQLRAAGQRAGDRHALLLAARQLGRIVAHARRKADALQRLADALPALGGRHLAVAQRHVDVVVDVEIGNQVEGLEDEADLAVADARAAVVAELADILAVELVAAAGRRFEQAGDVEEGRLARTRRPGDGDELALADVDGEIAQGVGLDDLGAERLRQMRHLQHGSFLSSIREFSG